jgi:septal ring factor EnvC (AmiA/AmiB activator)
VARKQARGKQISDIALIAAFFALALAVSLPSAQQQKGKAAPPAKAAAPAKAAESAVSKVETEIKQTQGALDSIKTELEKGRAKFKELQSEEGNYLSRLEQLEKNISISGQYMELVQSRIDTTEKTLELLGDSLSRAEANLLSARERMKQRLRMAYMTGEMNGLQMLLSAKNPTEFIYRVRYFQEINRYDRRLAETIRESIASVNEKKTAQEESRLALVKLLNEKKDELAAQRAEESSRRSVLNEIRTNKTAIAAMVSELEEAQRELDAIIKVLEERKKRVSEEERKAREEQERKAAVTFERRKGKLSWPVRGEVTSKFGKVVHPVYKTIIMNNGIDIAASKGTSVKSVAQGTVAHVGSMRGLGRLVIVDHNGGFLTIYAHLDEINVTQNQNVSIGTEIGTVGETGTAGGAKLHFEIRKAAESMDPEEWLER